MESTVYSGEMKLSLNPKPYKLFKVPAYLDFSFLKVVVARTPVLCDPHMSYSLNALKKGLYRG